MCSTGIAAERAQVRGDLQQQPMFPVAIGSAPVASRLRALRSPELGGGLGLLDVVGAGRAAAQLPLGRLDERDAGDRAQQRARRLRDALRVGEVAGVVVGDRSGARAAAALAAARAPRGRR